MAPVLALACNKPPNLVCRPVAFFQVLQPQLGSGAAPFSIEPLGLEVKRSKIDMFPTSITLRGNKEGSVSWGGGDFHVYTDLIYSPVEGLARNTKYPDNV